MPALKLIAQIGISRKPMRNWQSTYTNSVRTSASVGACALVTAALPVGMSILTIQNVTQAGTEFGTDFNKVHGWRGSSG